MSQIVDQWGRPFNKAVTKEPQTTRLVQLNSRCQCWLVRIHN